MTERTRDRRTYDSPLRARRARETRATLIRTATELFTTSGWTATGMREIARESGVAVETLYKHFPSKRKLLDAVIDEAAAGDAAPIPVAGRPEFLSMGRGSRADRIAAAAAVVTAIHSRTGRLARLMREAAAADAEIAEVLAEIRERQRTDVATGLELVLGRPPTPVERDGAWAIVSPELYLLLTEVSSWPVDDYERWLSVTLDALLPRR
ncbi:MAG: helix-turn-helix domain-containing protein [Microthrixaceae bacterium]